MQLHTFKACSLAEALRLVRDELGPDASVLHTRDVGSTLVRWLGGRLIEVTASAEVAVPSRLPEVHEGRNTTIEARCILPAELQDFRRKIREDLRAPTAAGISLVEQLSRFR
jgi:flagellar biosynthesis GTPase FlhF